MGFNKEHVMNMAKVTKEIEKLIMQSEFSLPECLMILECVKDQVELRRGEFEEAFGDALAGLDSEDGE